MKAEDLTWLIVGTIGPCAAVSFLATGLMRALAPRWGLVDRPNARKVHTAPIPLGGGIGVLLGVMVPFAAATLLLLLLRGETTRPQ
ncbi:MAG: hypothetical protein AB7F89_16950, partial [Pirellulaceae bacterium]